MADKKAKPEEKKGAKKAVGKTRPSGEFGAPKEPTVLRWETFAGKDGAIHCRPRGDAPRCTGRVGKAFLPDPKSVREMEQRRLAGG